LVEVAVVQGEGKQMALVVGIEGMYYNTHYVYIAWGFGSLLLAQVLLACWLG